MTTANLISNRLDKLVSDFDNAKGDIESKEAIINTGKIDILMLLNWTSFGVDQFKKIDWKLTEIQNKIFGDTDWYSKFKKNWGWMLVELLWLIRKETGLELRHLLDLQPKNKQIKPQLKKTNIEVNIDLNANKKEKISNKPQAKKPKEPKIVNWDKKQEIPKIRKRQWTTHPRNEIKSKWEIEEIKNIDNNKNNLKVSYVELIDKLKNIIEQTNKDLTQTKDIAAIKKDIIERIEELMAFIENLELLWNHGVRQKNILKTIFLEHTNPYKRMDTDRAKLAIEKWFFLWDIEDILKHFKKLKSIFDWDFEIIAKEVKKNINIIE